MNSGVDDELDLETQAFRTILRDLDYRLGELANLAGDVFKARMSAMDRAQQDLGAAICIATSQVPARRMTDYLLELADTLEPWKEVVPVSAWLLMVRELVRQPIIGGALSRTWPPPFGSSSGRLGRRRGRERLQRRLREAKGEGD